MGIQLSWRDLALALPSLLIILFLHLRPRQKAQTYHLTFNHRCNHPIMKYYLILAIALVSIRLSAQEFTVPKDLQLETEKDYLAQNDNIVAAVVWLRDTHLNKEPQKRKRVNTYLLQWLTGTPTMTLTLGPGLADYGDCADCLMLYMGGYAKAIIESGNDDPLATNLAAVRTVLAFYQNSKGRIGKNKVIQKFIKMEGKGKLEAEVAKRM